MNFTLQIDVEDGKPDAVFTVDLDLSPDDPVDTAVERLRDAIALFRATLARRENRAIINTRTLSGRPSDADLAMHDAAMRATAAE